MKEIYVRQHKKDVTCSWDSGDYEVEVTLFKGAKLPQVRIDGEKVNLDKYCQDQDYNHGNYTQRELFFMAIIENFGCRIDDDMTQYMKK